MKTFFLILITLTVLTAASAEPLSKSSSSVEPEMYYKDYKWNIGLLGGMTFDGQQTKAAYSAMGAGLHLGYHLTEFVTLDAEAVNYFTTLSSDHNLSKTTNSMYALSAVFDFSAERTYSLYAKGGFGYETQHRNNDHVDNYISMFGFGFRYMLSDALSAKVEGRWKSVLADSGYTDNSLVGTIGLDYHFGLVDN